MLPSATVTQELSIVFAGANTMFTLPSYYVPSILVVRVLNVGITNQNRAVGDRTSLPKFFG